MHRRRLEIGLFALLLVVSLTTCSLRTHPPMAIVEVRAPRLPATARVISDRQCFALFATGEGSDVTSAQVGTRQLVCLGIAGKYLGAFPYARLANTAVPADPVKVQLAYGLHKLTLLAVDKSGGCDNKDISYFFPNSDTGVAKAYPVGNSGDVTINADTGKIEITPKLYNDSVSLFCPRDSNPCSGADFCDTFTAAEGSYIAGHVPDIGGTGWTVGGFPNNPEIRGGRANITSLGGQIAYFLNDFVSRDAVLTTQVVLGSYGLSSSDVSLVGRWSDVSNFVEAHVTRSGPECTLAIVENIAGTGYKQAESPPFACDASATASFQLFMRNLQLSANYNGTTVSYASGSGLLFGTKIGYLTRANGSPATTTYADNLVVQRTARARDEQKGYADE